VSLDSEGFKIKLNFTSPLQVSAGDEPDLLLIQLDLSDYEDENGQKLPESIIKYSQIPAQISSQEEAEKVNDSGAAAGDGSKAATGGNFVVNQLMASSLKKVWAMIEGLQVVCHMPLINIKSPGNVNAFNEFLSELAFLDIIDTSTVANDLFYFPEMDPVGLNFQNAGFETNLLIPSLGTLFFMLLGQI